MQYSQHALTHRSETKLDSDEGLMVLADLAGEEIFTVCLGHPFHCQLLVDATELLFPRIHPLEGEAWVVISKWQNFEVHILTKFDFLQKQAMRN